MSHEQQQVTELVSAFERLRERALRIVNDTPDDASVHVGLVRGAVQSIGVAIAELWRHGAEALPIMSAAHRRFEERIFRVEMSVRPPMARA